MSAHVGLLIRAAMSWARAPPPPPAAVGETDERPLVAAFRARLAEARSKPSPTTLARFLELLAELGEPPDGAPPPARDPLGIDGRCVTFRPLLVPPGEHFEAQRDTFWALIAFWEHHACVERLVIDLREATSERVTALMDGVAPAEVVRGIRIWETLPCRIGEIVVLEPRAPTLMRVVRRTVPVFLPRKVAQKLRFESPGTGAQPSDEDGGDDPLNRPSRS